MRASGVDAVSKYAGLSPISHVICPVPATERQFAGVAGVDQARPLVDALQVGLAGSGGARPIVEEHVRIGCAGPRLVLEVPRVGLRPGHERHRVLAGHAFPRVPKAEVMAQLVRERAPREARIDDHRSTLLGEARRVAAPAG